MKPIAPPQACSSNRLFSEFSGQSDQRLCPAWRRLRGSRVRNWGFEDLKLSPPSFKDSPFLCEKEMLIWWCCEFPPKLFSSLYIQEKTFFCFYYKKRKIHVCEFALVEGLGGFCVFSITTFLSLPPFGFKKTEHAGCDIGHKICRQKFKFSKYWQRTLPIFKRCTWRKSSFHA